MLSVLRFSSDADIVRLTNACIIIIIIIIRICCLFVDVSEMYIYRYHTDRLHDSNFSQNFIHVDNLHLTSDSQF